MSQTEQEESHPGGPREKTLKIEKEKDIPTTSAFLSFRMSSNPSLAANQLEYFGHVTVTCLDLGSLGVSAHLRGLPRGLNELTEVWNPQGGLSVADHGYSSSFRPGFSEPRTEAFHPSPARFWAGPRVTIRGSGARKGCRGGSVSNVSVCKRPPNSDPRWDPGTKSPVITLPPTEI